MSAEYDWKEAYVEAIVSGRQVVLLNSLEADSLKLRHAWLQLGAAIESELQLNNKLERCLAWLAKLNFTK